MIFRKSGNYYFLNFIYKINNEEVNSSKALKDIKSSVHPAAFFCFSTTSGGYSVLRFSTSIGCGNIDIAGNCGITVITAGLGTYTNLGLIISLLLLEATVGAVGFFPF